MTIVETDAITYFGEDRSEINRETWIERILSEEEPRREMPELYETDEIVIYIAKTGGKAYEGKYNGDTYYLYLFSDCDTYGGYYPFVTVIKKMETIADQRHIGGRADDYRTGEDELFFEAERISQPVQD